MIARKSKFPLLLYFCLDKIIYYCQILLGVLKSAFTNLKWTIILWKEPNISLIITMHTLMNLLKKKTNIVVKDSILTSGSFLLPASLSVVGSLFSTYKRAGALPGWGQKLSHVGGCLLLDGMPSLGRLPSLRLGCWWDGQEFRRLCRCNQMQWTLSQNNLDSAFPNKASFVVWDKHHIPRWCIYFSGERR